MKKCPKCNRSFSDETLNFCLDDGTALMIDSGEPTDENIQRKTEQQTEILSYDQATEDIRVDRETEDFSKEKEKLATPTPTPNNSEPQIIKQGVSPMFAYLSVGLLALLILLVGAGIAYLVNSNSQSDSNKEFVSTNSSEDDNEDKNDTTVSGKEERPAISLTDTETKPKKTPKKEVKETPKKDFEEKPEPTKSTAPTATPKPTESPKEERGRYFVIFGSYKNPANAKKRMQLARSKGMPARIVNTNNIPGLRAGLKAVVMGPFTKARAKSLLGRAKSVSGDAYVKAG